MSSGSLGLVVAWLVAGGLGLPLPEDAAVLTAGALVYHGVVGPVLAFVLVMAAVLGGDLILFLVARRLGTAAYERPLFRRLLPPHRRERVEASYRRHGGKLVFAARHVVGLRAATFALAGSHGMAVRRFVLWDAAAACLSVPVMLALGYYGALHIDRVRSGLATIQHWIALGAIVAVVLGVVIYGLRHRDT